MNLSTLKDLWLEHYNTEDISQVYIHNPFCERICSFCAYKGKLPVTQTYDFYYKEYLPKFIDIFSSILEKMNKPVFWFGGGTPNIMKPAEMESIFSLLKMSNHKVIEVNPNLLTFEQIDIFKKYNISTISIGVQTFNNDILTKYNRSPLKNIEKYINYIHKVGMKVSVDLLALKGSNTLDLYNDLMKVAELEVEEIIVAYDYIFKGSPKATKSLVDVVEEFLLNSNYNTQDYIEDLYSWKLKKKAIQLSLDGFTHDSVLKYNSDLQIRDNISNYSTLGLGTWVNKNIYSKINNKVEYIISLDDEFNTVITRNI